MRQNTHDPHPFPPALSLEEFDAISENHTFSDDFLRREAALLRRYQRKTAAKSRRLLRSAAAVSLVILLGAGTAYAGVQIYRLRTEQKAPYAIEVIPEGEISDASADRETADPALAAEGSADSAIRTEGFGSNVITIPIVKTSVGYLPEGMVPPSETTNMFFTKMAADGVTVDWSLKGKLISTIMDTDDPMLATNIAEQRTVIVNDRESLLIVEAPSPVGPGEESVSLQIPFPEVLRIITIRLTSTGGAMDTETLIEEVQKIGASVTLTPTGEERTFTGPDLRGSMIMDADWDEGFIMETRRSDEIAMQLRVQEMNDAEIAARQAEDEDLAFDAADMANLRQVGEAIDLSVFWNASTFGSSQMPLEATVTDVQILDNLSVLQPEGVLNEKSWYELTDAEGNLTADTLQYIKAGDGMESIDTKVAETPIPVRLLYVTVEYKNTGDQALKDVRFMHELRLLERGDDRWIWRD